MTYGDVIALNRLVGATGRGPGIPDADAGKYKCSVFLEKFPVNIRKIYFFVNS
jgi:hypothetical protein